MDCIICQNYVNTPHHIKSRGAGGGDENFNLMPICLGHHQEVHTVGMVSFAKKYKIVKQFLVKNGWELDIFGRWRRPAEN